VPKCPNGHEQELGLKCNVCGADLSYKASVKKLLVLPTVRPEYGRVSLLRVGFAGTPSGVDYTGTLSVGEAEGSDAASFTVPRNQGGNWHEFKSKYESKLGLWLKAVGFDKTSYRLIVLDAGDPLSALAVSAVPQARHTLVVAITADPDSTPMEQSSSYAALSIAMKRGIPVIALGESYTRDLLFYTEEGGFATHADAVSRIVSALVHVLDDAMDLSERDLRLGGRVHYISAIISGSKTVYPSTGDALIVERHNLSVEPKPEEVRTMHAIILGEKGMEAEFTKSFTQFRTKNFKTAISAEARFHEGQSSRYDLLMLCGLTGEGLLGSLAEGYNTVRNALPELTVEASP
jgi:hypothetical protein